MSTPRRGGRSRVATAVVQVAAIALIVLSGLIFLFNQGQRADVTFDGLPPSVGIGDPADAPAVPTYAQIESQYAGQKIARLPGAIANFDEPAVLDAMSKTDVKQIVVAPPLPPNSREEIETPTDVLLITGLSASLSPFGTSATSLDSFAAFYARNDVTSAVITLLTKRADPKAEGIGAQPLTWREPTTDAVNQVVSDANDDGIAFVSGSTPFAAPTDEIAKAFPGKSPVIVVAPVGAPGELPVDYSAALTLAFPDRPLVLMTGHWIRYVAAGSEVDNIAIAASFYGQLERRLSGYSYSQEQVLRASLNRVEQFRYSEIFSRNTPYVPPDPVGVTMPFLPWLCAGLAVVCIGMSLRSAYSSRPAEDDYELVTGEQVSTYAALSELAVEVNPLVAGRIATGAMTRAFAALNEAGELVDNPTAMAEDMAALLERAETALQQVAVAIERTNYQPATFLAGRQA